MQLVLNTRYTLSLMQGFLLVGQFSPYFTLFSNRHKRLKAIIYCNLSIAWPRWHLRCCNTELAENSWTWICTDSLLSTYSGYTGIVQFLDSVCIIWAMCFLHCVGNDSAITVSVFNFLETFISQVTDRAVTKAEWSWFCEVLCVQCVQVQFS